MRTTDRRGAAEGASPRAPVHGLQAKRRASSLGVYLPLLATAAVVAGLDQLTKQVALRSLSDGPIDLIDSVLSLRLTFNPGGAFGVLQGVPGFFLVATVGIILFILVWVRKVEDARSIVPLGMVLGGGLGNLFDRLFRDETGGRVVDFVDLHVWPVFNLADASISIGVLLILWLAFRSERASSDQERAGGAGAEESEKEQKGTGE